jgi:hypothetical protein
MLHFCFIFSPFYSIKSENRRAEQVLPGGRGEMVEKGHGRVNMIQKICIHICKYKRNTCWNNSRNWGEGE